MAFASHSAWISELREQYATIGSRGPVPSGFGGLGEPQLMEHLDERFNEALDFVDEPVYRSVSTDLSWQPANDELYFDSDEPVYRPGRHDVKSNGPAWFRFGVGYSMVRVPAGIGRSATAADISKAVDRGDFYASTGIELVSSPARCACQRRIS